MLQPDRQTSEPAQGAGVRAAVVDQAHALLNLFFGSRASLWLHQLCFSGLYLWSPNNASHVRPVIPRRQLQRLARVAFMVSFSCSRWYSSSVHPSNHPSSFVESPILLHPIGPTTLRNANILRTTARCWTVCLSLRPSGREQGRSRGRFVNQGATLLSRRRRRLLLLALAIQVCQNFQFPRWF